MSPRAKRYCAGREPGKRTSQEGGSHIPTDRRRRPVGALETREARGREATAFFTTEKRTRIASRMVDQYSMHRTQATCLCVEESLKILKHLWSLQEDIIQARKLYHQHTAFSLRDPREIALVPKKGRLVEQHAVAKHRVRKFDHALRSRMHQPADTRRARCQSSRGSAGSAHRARTLATSISRKVSNERG